jgi:DNA-binding transcriptional ArsR family regulator
VTYELTLRALADPTRRAMYERLATSPLGVSELAREVGISQPAASQHLAILRDAALVRATRAGRHRLYAVDPRGLEMLRGYLDRYWQRALQAFAEQPSPPSGTPVTPETLR